MRMRYVFLLLLIIFGVPAQANSGLEGYFNNCRNLELPHNEDNVLDWMACLLLYCQKYQYDPFGPAPRHRFEGVFQADNYMRVFRTTAASSQELLYDGVNVPWDRRDTINFNIRPGDLIRFEVRNQNGPGGFKGYWYYRNIETGASTRFETRPETFINSHELVYSQVADSWRFNVANVAAQWIWRPNAQIWQWCEDCTVNFYWRAPGPREFDRYDGCRWYRRLRVRDSGPKLTEQDLAEMFQELKNFIAIQQLEYMRDKVVDQVTPAPMTNQTQFAAYKAKVVEPKIIEEMQQREWQLFVWDMFNPRQYTAASHLYLHFKGDCSFFESNFSAARRYCGVARQSMPWDMVADSLLAGNEIPGRGTDYLYRRVDGQSRDYFFVDEIDRGNFEQRYANNPASIFQTYDGVNKQQAALKYIRNLTSAVPMPVLKDKDMFQDKGRYIFNEKKGIPNLISKFTLVSLLSMSRQSLFQMYAERLEHSNFTLPQGVDSVTQKGSFLTVLAHESNRRFDDKVWQQIMEQLPADAMLKEVASMYALQTYLKFRTLKHIERFEAVLAASVAHSIGSAEKGKAQAIASANTQLPT